MMEPLILPQSCFQLWLRVWDIVSVFCYPYVLSDINMSIPGLRTLFVDWSLNYPRSECLGYASKGFVLFDVFPLVC